MTQSRAHSLVESFTNIAVGFGVAVGAQYAIFPVFGLHASHSEHLAIGSFFTAVSLVRSYCLRRLFNRWSA